MQHIFLENLALAFFSLDNNIKNHILALANYIAQTKRATLAEFHCSWTSK